MKLKRCLYKNKCRQFEKDLFPSLHICFSIEIIALHVHKFYVSKREEPDGLFAHKAHKGESIGQSWPLEGRHVLYSSLVVDVPIAEWVFP